MRLDKNEVHDLLQSINNNLLEINKKLNNIESNTSGISHRLESKLAEVKKALEELE